MQNLSNVIVKINTCRGVGLNKSTYYKYLVTLPAYPGVVVQWRGVLWVIARVSRL